MRKFYYYPLPKTYKEELEKIQKRWSTDTKLRQSEPEWKENVWRGDYRKFLHNIQSGLCAYCDTLVVAGTNGDVEHIRHKKKYIDHKFRWDNWVLSCKNCNIAKGPRDTVNEKWINPRKHFPTNFLNILPTGKLVSRQSSSKEKQMAENTINGTDLNCERTNRSKELKEHRKAAAAELESLIQFYIVVRQNGDQFLLNKTKELIIDYCTNSKQNFRGIALCWLLTRVNDGVIEKEVYEMCLNELERKKPNKSEVFKL